MKTKLNINGEEVEITLTSEQIEAITQATTKNEFEIDYDYKASFIHVTGTIDFTTPGPNSEIRDFGMFRKTPELAERARDAMRARNKLEELAHWLEPEWKADWEDGGQEKWAIYYNYTIKTFHIESLSILQDIGRVYMSLQTAIKISDALNNGELEELREILLKG